MFAGQALRLRVHLQARKAPPRAKEKPVMIRPTLLSMTVLLPQFILALVTFTVFCSAYPDSYRSRLWAFGGQRGWNSDPELRIYFYANYEEPPAIPLIWSQSVTDSALAISTLSLTICIARMVLLYYGVTIKLIDAGYSVILGSLWCYSLQSQSSSDLSDREHLSIRPWYLERGCRDVTEPFRDACVFGQASFALALISMLCHWLHLLLMALQFAYECGERRLKDQLAIAMGASFTSRSGYKQVSSEMIEWGDDLESKISCGD